MPSTLRSQGPPFIFVGEHRALDFANTLITPVGVPQEFFPSWSEVVNWFAVTGLSQDPSLNLSISRGGEALKSVLKLRETWQNLLARLITGGKVSDDFLQSLNHLLSEDTFSETIQREGSKGFHFVRSSTPLSGAKLALTILARQIASFLVSANLEYLHRCANTESCTLYFYDTTKNHRRQWCSAASCGNRHKVAAFRERQK